MPYVARWSRGAAGALLLLASAAHAQGLLIADSGTPYTADQATQGRPLYVQTCQSCHGAALEGTQFGPALTGAVFEGHWRGRTRAAFSQQIRTTMPPGRLGSLSSEAYANVESYILQANAGAAPADARAAPRPQNQAAGMMGAMQRPDKDPQYLAALKSHTDKLSALTSVTDAALQHPAAADWLMGRRTYDGLGYSPLSQINRSNVQHLRTAWSWVLPPSVNEMTPLIHDGVLFVSSGPAVQALDAATGDLLWQYLRSLPSGQGFGSSHGRALAIYGEKLFAPTADGHLVALETRTGHLLWDHEIVPSGAAGGGLALNGAPIVVKGTVIIGVSLGVGNPGGCFIVGLDAGSGKEKWRFHTIARPGQPGGDSWNGAPVEERFGGGVWTIGSYDPALDLVYFGIGNTYDTATLLEPRSGSASVSSNDGLYTDSTVALHPDTGALAWYFQHQKRDVWDLDWVFEQSLVRLNVAGRPKMLVVTGGKTALFEAMDAATGAFVFSSDVGVQNLVTAVDPLTGEKQMNPAIQPEAGKAKLMCPNSIGARNWQATALNPDSGVLFVPVLENCADYTYTPRGAAQTAQGGLDMHFSSRPPPHHDGNFGRLVAIDLQKRQILWTHRQRIPFASSTLATAGGLLFTGDVDRYFAAYDQATGKVLWRTRLAAAPESSPVTFAAHGHQYLAVVAGSGSPMGSASRAFVPDVVAPAAGVTLIVFELP
ncbi:MAG TPA: PQQ-binding-like beta-propeller repeat protein [Steroidobacteraceae bacterium]|nr:PQQ-binding-like beta-propeller repeat protein [Steroidobacteraceae bacterium]